MTVAAKLFDPIFGRHLSNFFSARSTISVESIPVIAQMSTAAKTLSVCKVAPATVIMKPMSAPGELGGFERIVCGMVAMISSLRANPVMMVTQA